VVLPARTGTHEARPPGETSHHTNFGRAVSRRSTPIAHVRITPSTGKNAHTIPATANGVFTAKTCYRTVATIMSCACNAKLRSQAQLQHKLSTRRIWPRSMPRRPGQYSSGTTRWRRRRLLMISQPYRPCRVSYVGTLVGTMRAYLGCTCVLTCALLALKSGHLGRILSCTSHSKCENAVSLYTQESVTLLYVTLYTS